MDTATTSGTAPSGSSGSSITTTSNTTAAATAPNPSICVPDILYIICSLLDIKDVRRFRLCCRAFADAAAPFVYRRIVVYPHKQDLEMLRRLSLDPVVAPNVRNIIYVGHMLGRPRVDLPTFTRQFDTAKKLQQMLLNYKSLPGRPNLLAELEAERGKKAAIETMKLDDVRTWYKEYEDTLVEQDYMLAHDLDTAALLETIPRFTSLRDFTFSSCFEFYHQDVTPFRGCLLFATPTPAPRGCREVVAFLRAAAASSAKLESLTLGLLSWRFFHEERALLAAALRTCKDLTTFRICIDTGMKEGPSKTKGLWTEDDGPGVRYPNGNDDEDEDDDEGGDDDNIDGNDRHQGFGTEVHECAEVMSTGLLREFLRHLENLETLQVSFSYNSDDWEFPARIGDVIQPRHRWEFLASLRLENVACERQELMSVLRRHRDTLDSLALHNIALRSTSWLVLLPQIRKTMDLVSVSMGGELFGCDERYLMDEYWDLTHDSGYASELKFDLNRYLKSQSNVQRCPLNRDNNEA